MTLKDMLIANALLGSHGGGGGGISVDDIAQNLAPIGAITLGSGVTHIADHAFQGKAITSVKGDNVEQIDPYSFANTLITGITDEDFPKLGVDTEYTIFLRLPTTCTAIKLSGEKIRLNSGSGAMRDCKGLVTAEFPNAAKSVASPNNKGLASNSFYGCTALTLADCGYVTSISSYAFQNCESLDAVILRNTSLVTLGNKNAFVGTKYDNGKAGGTIYIPKVLYDHLGDGTADDYKAASNWSTLDGYGTITWAKLEGSPYEDPDWDDSGFLT